MPFPKRNHFNYTLFIALLGFTFTLNAQQNNLILQGSSNNQWQSSFIKFESFDHDDDWTIEHRGTNDANGFKGISFQNHNTANNTYETPLFLDVDNKVGIGTNKPDFKLSVNGFAKIGGTTQSQLMLADRGWSGSHAILFNSYPSESFVNGGLNVYQNTKYANDPGNFSNGAGGVFFNANGEGVFEIKLSKVSTGKGQSVEWEDSSQFSILRNGNVSIGVLSGENYNNAELALVDHRLTVNGKIRTQEVKVTNDNWPDYVFEEEYDLISINELRKYIDANKHLPNIPSAEIVEKEGLYLGDMDSKLLRKIEELTLYTLEQDKTLSKQKNKLEQLEKENQEIKKLLTELLKVK